MPTNTNTNTNEPAGSPAAPPAASPAASPAAPPAAPGNTTASNKKNKNNNNLGPLPKKPNKEDVALKGSAFEMAMELLYNNKGKELARDAREFFGKAYDKLKNLLKPPPTTAVPADEVAAVKNKAAAAAKDKNSGQRNLEEERVEMSEINPEKEKEKEKGFTPN